LFRGWRGSQTGVLGRSAKMVKTAATHLCELDAPPPPAGGFATRRASRVSAGAVRAYEWVGTASTPDRYLDFLQLGDTLMGISWGRRGGRSDSAWLDRDRGFRDRGPTTALTRHGSHGDDTIGPIWALSHRSDRTPMVRLAQLTPHHFRRGGRRSAIRRLMAGAAAFDCVSVMPAASIRLAPCGQTNGSGSARLLRCARSGCVAKGRSR
jgi:hypothetical protein